MEQWKDLNDDLLQMLLYNGKVWHYYMLSVSLFFFEVGLTVYYEWPSICIDSNLVISHFVIL